MAATNPAYFASLTAQINALQGTGACAALQSIVNQVTASLQAEVTAIKVQISGLATMITPPTDLGSCISWITAAQAPIIQAYEKALAQLTAFLASVAALVAAMQAAAARMTSCTITVPSIS